MMNRKTMVVGSVAAAAMLAFATVSAPAATDFSKVIPQDAWLAVWVEDFPALRKGAENGPYGRLWNDPASDKLRNWVASEIKKAEAESPDEMRLEQMIDLLKGGIAFYMLPPADGTDIEGASAIGLVESDEEGVTKLREEMSELEQRFISPTKDSYTVGDTTVYRIVGIEKPDSDLAAAGAEASDKATTIHYAFVGNTLVYADSTTEEPVKLAINRLKGGVTENGLDTHTDVRRFREKRSPGPNQLQMFMNVGNAVRSGVSQGGAMTPQQLQAVESSGLYDIRTLMLAVTLAEVVDVDGAIGTPEQLNGVVRALVDTPATPLNMVKWAPADALSVSSFSLDVGAIYDSVVTLMQQSNPDMLMMANMMLAGQQAQLGVDVVNGILKNIKGEHLVVQRPLDPAVKSQLPPELADVQNSQVIYLGLANGATVAENLKKLTSTLTENPAFGAPIKTSDMDGVTVIEMTTPAVQGSPMKPGIAFNNQAIVITTSDVHLPDAIRQMTGKGTSSLMDKPGLAKALSDANKQGLLYFQYSPAESVVEGMKQLRSILQSGMLEQLGTEFDSSILPPPETFAKYFGDSHSTINKGQSMVYFNARVLPSQQGQ